MTTVASTTGSGSVGDMFADLLKKGVGDVAEGAVLGETAHRLFVDSGLAAKIAAATAEKPWAKLPLTVGLVGASGVASWLAARTGIPGLSTVGAAFLKEIGEMGVRVVREAPTLAGSKKAQKQAGAELRTKIEAEVVKIIDPARPILVVGGVAHKAMTCRVIRQLDSEMGGGLEILDGKLQDALDNAFPFCNSFECWETGLEGEKAVAGAKHDSVDLDAHRAYASLMEVIGDPDLPKVLTASELEEFREFIRKGLARPNADDRAAFVTAIMQLSSLREVVGLIRVPEEVRAASLAWLVDKTAGNEVLALLRWVGTLAERGGHWGIEMISEVWTAIAEFDRGLEPVAGQLWDYARGGRAKPAPRTGWGRLLDWLLDYPLALFARR